MTRFALVTRGGEPHLWDFGSAAKHHRLYCPWLPPENIRGGMIGLRGAVAPAASSPARPGDRGHPARRGRVRHAGRRGHCGAAHVGGARGLPDHRTRRAADHARCPRGQVAGRDHAAEHGPRHGRRRLPAHQRAAQAGGPRKPAGRGGHQSALRHGQRARRQHQRRLGERCSPHPHVFSDRLIRPGDQAFFDIIQTFVGYKTCYYRTFVVGHLSDAQRDAYKRAREWIDKSIELMRPGVTTEALSVWPKAEEFGFDSEMECFGLQFGHGVGLFLHERPIISRLNSLEHPIELKEGMVIALETYCPAKDGYSAARIEEEVVVTPMGRRSSPTSRPRSCSWRTRTDGQSRRPWNPRRRIAPSSTAISACGCIGPCSMPLLRAAHPRAVPGRAGARHHPPGHWAGGGGGRRRRRHARRRLDLLHLSRPQPHAGARRPA